MGDLGCDGTHVVELAASSPDAKLHAFDSDVAAGRAARLVVHARRRLTTENPGVDRHGDVRPLSAHRGSLAEIQPLSADLAERVAPPLGRRAIVPRSARPDVGVDHGSKRRQQRLAGLGVEVAVDPHHPEERGGGVESTPMPQLLLPIDGSFPLGPLAPVPRDPLEVAHGVDAGHLDELGLAPSERGRLGLAGRHQHAHRRQRDLARLERPPSPGHLPEGPGHPRLLPRRPPRHPERARQPRGSREVAVPPEQATAFDLRQTAQPLRLEGLRGRLELGEVLLDPGVGQLDQILGPQRLDRRPQLTHAAPPARTRTDIRILPSGYDTPTRPRHDVPQRDPVSKATGARRSVQAQAAHPDGNPIPLIGFRPR